MTGKLFRTALVAILAAGATTLAGCANKVGDIDRTQPNLLPKSMFVGETPAEGEAHVLPQWFVRQTVVDVPETSAFSFIGETGAMEMIVWEVQEDYLVGYRGYEFIPGADSNADHTEVDVNFQDVMDGRGEGTEPDVYKGQPIVAYPIQGHVDVIRQYNPRTGEQTNVIVEDSSDRPWSEREFIRVDWASPQVFNWFFISNPAFNAASTTLSTYAQHDAEYGTPDAFRVCYDNSEECDDGRLDKGEDEDRGAANYFDFTERLFAYPDVAGCLFTLYPGQIPRSYGAGDCTAQEVKVRTSFLKVDPERERAYEPLFYDDNRQGEFGYFRTERITYDRQRGTTQQGVIYLANRHEVWERSLDENGDPIPYAERTLRPIVYHLSPGYPDSMKPVTEEIRQEYDQTFKEVVAFRRNQSIAQLENDLIAQTGDSCLFCVNENADGQARVGDLRYSFIGWVDSVQRHSPLGYGPSSAHPETGRIVAGMAYVYGAPIDTYATYAKDIVDLLNGDRVEEDFMGADFLREEIANRYSQTDPRQLARFDALDRADLDSQILGDRLARFEDRLETQGLAELRPGWDQRRLDRVRGTELESLLINQEVLNAHGVRPDDILTEDLMEEISPLNDSSVTSFRAMEELRNKAARHNVWLADFGDPSIAGLAQQVKDMGLEGDALWQYLREQIYKAVMLHEIGHTVGLRHNFGASSDALNYFDEYWPLRSQTLIENPASVGDLLRGNCTLIDRSNESACSAAEQGRMKEFQYSSIMDYGSKFNSDFAGLGRYDRAAMAAAYGNLVEVFEPSMTDSLDAGFQQDLRTFAGLRNPLFGSLTEGYHYTRLPALFGGIENMTRRSWVPRENYDFESETAPIRVPYVACYDEYRDATSTCHTWDEGADPYEIVENWIHQYREYYVFNNFQRDRLGFSPYDVYSRVAGRYFLPIQNMYQHWIFDRFYSSQDALRGDYGTIGLIEGINTLLNVLATPRYGSYQFDQNENEYQWIGYDMDMDGADLSIQPGLGKRTYSRYNFEAGYNIFGRILESGMYYEQRAALLALVSNDASALGAGSDVGADFRSFSLPYYLVFEQDINNVFSAVVRDDYPEFAPVVTADGQVQFTDMLATISRPAGTPINVDTSFSTRIYTMLYGMALLSMNYDLGFVQRGEVVVHEGDAVDPAPGFEAVTFEDPGSGRVYTAYRPDGGDPTGGWLAAEKIDELNALRDEYDALPAGSDAQRNLGFQIDGEVEDLELLRSMYYYWGRNF